MKKDDLQRQFDELQAQMAQVQTTTTVQQSRELAEDQGAFKELYEQERQTEHGFKSRLLNETLL